MDSRDFQRGDRSGLGPLVSGASGWLLAALVSAVPSQTAGQSYHFESRTLGYATQFRRLDGSTADRRRFTQGLTVSGYDLLGDHTGSIRARADVRYTTDFGVPADRRDDPPFERQWNDAAVRLGYLRWRPDDAVELTAGRQWSRGVLGLRDFDGLHAEVAADLGAATAPIALYGGRDVQRETGPFATDFGDIPGAPDTRRDDAEERFPWMAGGRAGLEWGTEGSFQFAYRRRWRSGSGTALGSERLGLAASFAPVDRLTVSSTSSYHTILQRVDRAEIDLAWALPPDGGVLSAGLEHRIPWFDANSIFNVFGAYPHRGARLSYSGFVSALATTLRARSWGRIYTPPLRASEPAPLQGRRLGGALSHRTDVSLPDRVLEWDSEVSLEISPGVAGGHHWRADSELTLPLRVFEGLEVFTRVLHLRAAGDSLRPRGRHATTYVAGTSAPISTFGHIRLLGETTFGDIDFDQTNLYVTLDFSAGP